MNYSSFRLDSLPLADRRGDLLFLARIAHAHRRFEDVCRIHGELFGDGDSIGSHLSAEELELFASGYKQSIEPRFEAWRSLKTAEHKDDPKIVAYRGAIEAEIRTLCEEAIGILSRNTQLMAGSVSEGEVFLHCLRGDLHAWMAQVFEPETHVAAAETVYQEALTTAHNHLSPVNPLRLQVALSWVLFLHDLKADPRKAGEAARSAFQEALSKLDQLDERKYDAATGLMASLKEKAELWEVVDTDDPED